MHLPSSVRDRSFYAKFYSRPPSEIEIIEKTPSSSSNLRTLSQSPTAITPLSDGFSSITSGFLSSSDCSSSSESTTFYTKRRRTTGPIIQERLNTYESAFIRPNVLTPSIIVSKQKNQLKSPRPCSSLVNQIMSGQISIEQTKSSNLINTDTSKSDMIIHDESSIDSTINQQYIPFDSSKRYLSKSTSQLCEQSFNQSFDEQISSPSRNILDMIQEELVNSTFSLFDRRK